MQRRIGAACVIIEGGGGRMVIVCIHVFRKFSKQ